VRECHPAVIASPKAVQWSRDRGCKGHRILRRVPCRSKASWTITRCFRSRENAHGWSRRSTASSDPCTEAKSRRHGDMQPSRRRGRREVERESATGMSEARSQSVPWEENAHAHDGGRKVLGMRFPHRQRSAEAVSDVVKRPVPRSCRTEPKTPWGVPAAKVASGAGSTRGAGTRSSTGWQKSIGRIARLLHREVARPAGERGR
jgi:hypothetical protein